MDKLLKQEEIIRKNNEFKRNSNKFLKVFLVIFIAGYTFFFTSTLWMPAKETDINVTRLGTSIEVNNRSITPLVWIYCPEDKKMEVIIEIINKSLDGIDDYKWTALDSRKGFFNVTKVVNNPDFVVLQIDDVSPKWTEISLRMDVDAKTLGNKEFNTVKMYAAKSSIDMVENIKKGSMEEYQKIAIATKIKGAKAEIKKMKVLIAEEEKIIKTGEDKVENLKADMKYQTEEEKVKTQESISLMEADITSSKDRIDDYNEKIKQEKEKIKLQEKKAAQL